MKTKLILSGICFITFASRVLGQVQQVFVDGHTLFRGADAWYHVRLAAYTLWNWPQLLRNDWFANPLGQPPNEWPPLTTYAIALPFLTERQMEIWAAFLPPVVAVGVVVVIYFLAKEVFHNRGYALITALLVGILPSEFFLRTMLGFTDHHMFEVLFTCLSLLFVLKLHKRFIWCLPLGLSLGLLFLTWAGAAFVMLTVTIGVVIQFYRNYINNDNFARFGMGFGFASVIALMFFSLYSSQSISPVNTYSLVLGIGIGIITSLALLIESKKTFLTLTTIGCAGLMTVLAITIPVRDILAGFLGYGSTEVVSEMSPSTLLTLFSSFGLTLLLGFAGLIIYLKKEREHVLPIFFVITFLVTLAHVRYSYYSIIPIAVFTVYFIHWLGQKLNMRTVITTVVIVFVLMASLVNIVRLATYENDITPSMDKAMTWLRENTPSPYDSPNAFYEELDSNADYLVLTLWDYNAWIICNARRSPVTNGNGMYYPEIAQFFIDGSDPAPYVEKLYGRNIPIRYVIIDDNMLDSNWLEFITGSSDYKYAREMYYYQIPEWEAMYTNSEVRIFERVK